MNNFNYNVLGESVRKSVWDSLLKTSLARKCLASFPIKEGEVGRLGREKPYVFPQDITITSKIDNLNKDSDSSISDSKLVDFSYNKVLREIMTEEEDMFKILLETVVGSNKNLIYYDKFDFDKFLMLMSLIIKPDKCLMSGSLWSDFIADPLFSRYFNPVPKYNSIMKGYMGEILGVSLYSDLVRDTKLRMLRDGEVYMLPTSIKLGGITQRSILKLESLQSPKRWYDSSYEGSDECQYRWNFSCIEGLAIISNQVAKMVKVS